jgi:hypothetical protein
VKKKIRAGFYMSDRTIPLSVWSRVIQARELEACATICADLWSEV